MSRKVQNLGITIPKTVMEKLDIYRGDVSKSRYVTRLLEKSFNESQSKKSEGFDISTPTPSDVRVVRAIDEIDYSLRKSVSDTANG